MGKCSNTRSDAPVYDPSWEVWTLGWDPMPVCHRTFEMHRNWRDFRGDPDDSAAHRAWLAGQTVPVYMIEKEPDVPTSVRYPIEDIHKLVGSATGAKTPYLESSISYMVALAILELQPNDRMAIYGVDMATDGEYVYQRANLEYLVGLARGRGIKVYIPPQSALMKHAFNVPYGYWQATDPGAPQTPIS